MNDIQNWLPIFNYLPRCDCENVVLDRMAMQLSFCFPTRRVGVSVDESFWLFGRRTIKNRAGIHRRLVATINSPLHHNLRIWMQLV